MADWTTAITIIGSFGAASTAQIVSHILTNKREKNKYERECLQNLYAPVVFIIDEYICAEHTREQVLPYIEFSEYQEKFENPDSIFKKLLSFLSDNLRYATPSIIMAYQECRSIREDMEDNIKDEDEKYYSLTFNLKMKMCRELILEFIKISSELGALSKSVRDSFSNNLFFIEVCLLLEDCALYSLADKPIKYMSPIIRTLININENDFLNRITSIRKEIIRATETNAYKDRNRHKEVITDAYHFLHEIIDEYSLLSGEDTDDWRNELEIGWRKRDEIPGLS